MKKFSLLLLIFLVSTLIFTVTTAPAIAAESIFEHQDTVIPEQQMSENVIVMGGDATVYGSVRDTVIVINGNLNIKKSAHIMGLVLVVGGKINQETGAQVSESVVNINFDKPVLNSLFVGGALLLGTWFLRLAFSLLLIIIPVLLALITKNHQNSFSNITKRSPRKLLLVGFVISLLLTAVSVFLSLSVIGIPVVLMLILILLLIFFFGLSVVVVLVGEKMPSVSQKPFWLVALIGALAVAAGINFPFLGGLLILGLFWLSLGMVTLWFWERRKK